MLIDYTLRVAGINEYVSTKKVRKVLSAIIASVLKKGVMSNKTLKEQIEQIFNIKMRPNKHTVDVLTCLLKIKRP